MRISLISLLFCWPTATVIQDKFIVTAKNGNKCWLRVPRWQRHLSSDYDFLYCSMYCAAFLDAVIRTFAHIFSCKIFSISWHLKWCLSLVRAPIAWVWIISQFRQNFPTVFFHLRFHGSRLKLNKNIFLYSLFQYFPNWMNFLS